MKKCLFITNYPSPYRVEFFNLLGKYVELTVTFNSKPEEQKHRTLEWFNNNYSGFNAVFLEKKRKIGKLTINTDIISYLKKEYDYIILGGYASGTQMLSIEYLKIRNIPFFIEADGGLIQNDTWIKKYIKRHFISSANAWFSSGKVTTDYFVHYGADNDRVFEYPFTSQNANELSLASGSSYNDRIRIRQQLKLPNKSIVLFVGQFVYGKGIDVLLKAASLVDAEFYFVGGEPVQQYIELIEQLHLTNIHFVGFKIKDDLINYYRAADVLAMPTRSDVWGLVVSEALSYGLPVVSSDKCVAGLELIKNGINGYIVPVDNYEQMAIGIKKALCIKDGRDAAISSVANRSIENMVTKHLEAFDIVTSIIK